MDMHFADLDNDGFPEIIMCGVNNAFKSACVVVFDSRYLNGFSPATERYQLEGAEPGFEKYYILIPPTIVGKAYQEYGIAKWNSAFSIVLAPSGKKFKITLQDHNLSGEFITFYAHFGFDMRPLYFDTSDHYDMVAKKLFEEGRISRLPDQTYFEEYKKELKYWNGKNWVNLPAMNSLNSASTNK